MKISRNDKIKLIAISCVIGFVIFLAIFGDALCSHDPEFVDMSVRLLPPCKEYLLGTDMLGRCLSCRILSGLKYSLVSGVVIVTFTGFVGTVLGVIGAYFRGIPDKLLLYVNIIFQSFPGFVLAVFIAGILGQGLINGIIALCISGWTRYARLSRSLAFEVVNADYVKAARISGLRFGKIFSRHVIPNILIPLAVNMALSISDAIVSIAGLSFLGIGAAPPTPEWGTMIADSRSYFQVAPWTIIMPGLALFILVIIFNLFADALQKVLDPRETVPNRRKEINKTIHNMRKGVKHEN